jgi:hypothetical protein
MFSLKAKRSARKGKKVESKTRTKERSIPPVKRSQKTSRIDSLGAKEKDKSSRIQPSTSRVFAPGLKLEIASQKPSKIPTCSRKKTSLLLLTLFRRSKNLLVLNNLCRFLFIFTFFTEPHNLITCKKNLQDAKYSLIISNCTEIRIEF